MDVALRGGAMKDSNLISQKILTMHNVLVASKAYIDTWGEIKTIADLHHHKLMYYSNVKSVEFIKNNKAHKFNLTHKLMSNSLTFVEQMVRRDTVIGLLPSFMVKEALEKKQLIHCLADYSLEPTQFYAVYPSRDYMPAKLTVFLKELMNYVDKHKSKFN